MLLRGTPNPEVKMPVIIVSPSGCSVVARTAAGIRPADQRIQAARGSVSRGCRDSEEREVENDADEQAVCGHFHKREKAGIGRPDELVLGGSMTISVAIILNGKMGTVIWRYFGRT